MRLLSLLPNTVLSGNKNEFTVLSLLAGRRQSRQVVLHFISSSQLPNVESIGQNR